MEHEKRGYAVYGATKDAYFVHLSDFKGKPKIYRLFLEQFDLMHVPY